MPAKRLAIFDFCGTLIQFQTANRYVSYCVERLKGNKSVQFRHNCLRLMDALRAFKIYYHLCPSNNWRKRVVLWQLKGVTISQCDSLACEYFKDELLPNVVSPLVEKLKQHLIEGDRVCILSGGYDIYIKYFAMNDTKNIIFQKQYGKFDESSFLNIIYFAEYFGVKEVVSSKVAFSGGVCLGKMEGADCMRGNKLDYIRPLIDNMSTVCYTDSQSDIPLLELVDEPIVVSKSNPQDWATKRNYKQIIWN